MRKFKKAEMTMIALVLVLIITSVMAIAIGTNTSKENLTDAEIESTVTSEFTTPQTIISEPIDNSPAITITAEEREILARLVYLESSICSDDCQRAVVSVVFNRLDSGRWRKDVNKDGEITLYDIVYYPNAFTPASKIATTTPNQSAYDAVDYVLENGITVPTYVRYFRTSYDFKWDGYENYTIMDNVYFGYFVDWENGAW